MAIADYYAWPHVGGGFKLPTNPFIPVKIVDEKWADRLLDGEVFMRSLYEFGSWGIQEKELSASVKNSFRGDTHEGAIKVFSSPRDCDAFKGADPDFLDVINDITYIDYSDAQYFKIFSLYSLMYDKLHDTFIMPDPRIQDFGDTAVIILDMDTFLRRLLQTILKLYDENVSFLMDVVSYFDYDATKEVSPFFSKKKSYSYQNEMRIALGLLENNIYAMGGDNIKSIIMSTDALKLQLGDIRDIAVKIPIDDFLILKIPNDISFKFPMSVSEKPCMFDMIVSDTRKGLMNYRSRQVKPTVTIR